jgi:cytosine/creatinine deaminase
MVSTKMKVDFYDVKKLMLKKIKQKGGWVNCHAHIDRSFTLTKEKYDAYQKSRKEKWTLNRDWRKECTVDQLYKRMAISIETFIEQGVYAVASFIDVDKDIKEKAIKAAYKAREKYKSQIIIKYLNQSSYGILSKENRPWFELGVEFADIVGGLLKADHPREEEHLDLLLSTAKRLNKMTQVHIDELNIPEERETELLAKKVIEYGLQGRVAGIHGISINCRSKKEREHIYDLSKKAGLMFISCPLAWIDGRRSEEISPIHNSITPIDEMIPRGITVGMGTDNIADIFKPFNDGDMWSDMRVLLEASRYYEIDELVNIATVNGRKVLGIE